MRLASLTRVFLAVGLLGLTGCENGNLFGKLHDSGDSSDLSVLASDAQVALNNKDFGAALELFEKILAQDPDNASALHGAAIAALGSAGLNFGQLVANIAKNNAAPGINSLHDIIGAAREGGYSTQAAEANSLLAGVDLERLNAVIDEAICRMQQIVSGVADNTISPTDAAVLIDLGVVCAIRAALRPVREDFFDIVNDAGDYKIFPKTDFGTFCSNSANHPLAINVVQDLVNAYALFNRAADVLGLSSSALVARVREDVAAAVEESLDGDATNDLPAGCVTVINTAGITAANFRTRSTIFTPPAGC